MGPVRALVSIGTLLVLLVALVGCGAEEGVAEDAVVAVYAEAPLCADAERVLAREIARSGPRVRLVCLPSSGTGGGVDLAALGANARRATEDSTAVAYLAVPDGRAIRFTRPLLESAQIPLLAGPSGGAAMTRTLEAISATDSSSSVREQLDESLG